MLELDVRKIRPRNKNPSITCFKSTNDLLRLKEWFFYSNGKEDNRQRALQRVKALSSRGKLPHAVESTSLLVSISLTDPITKSKCLKQKDSNILKMSYTMAIIRFVNGLLDPFQQSNYAIPLHQLAKNLNLPSFFVELRHMGTHEQLPSLDILRIGTKMALDWLYNNYWSNILETYQELDAQEGEKEFTEVDSAKILDIIQKSTITVENITTHLKLFKKIRKKNMDVIYKFGNSSEIGTKYWKSVKEIKKFVRNDPKLVMKCLIFNNHLIYNKEKLNSRNEKKGKFNSLLIKLYRPLLDELGTQFKLDLALLVLNYVKIYNGQNTRSKFNQRIDEKLEFEFNQSEEVDQIMEWVLFLIEDTLTFSLEGKFQLLIESDLITSRESLIYYLVDQSSSIDNKMRYMVISKINEFTNSNAKYSKEIKEYIKNELISLEKAIKLDSFVAPPSLEELFGDVPQKRSCEEPPNTSDNKKQKITSTNETPNSTFYFFEKHTDWKPVPFGTSI